MERFAFSSTNIIMLIQNLLNLMANIFICSNQLTAAFKIDRIEYLINVLVGFSAFFSWFSLFDILKDYEGMQIVAGTFRNSAKSICYFVMGITPLIFGFIFLGLCTYMSYHRFDSFKTGYVTYLAFWTGQSLQSDFIALMKQNTWFAFWMLCTWLFFMYFGAANVFIFLLGAGYEEIERELQKRKENQEL